MRRALSSRNILQTGSVSCLSALPGAQSDVSQWSNSKGHGMAAQNIGRWLLLSLAIMQARCSVCIGGREHGEGPPVRPEDGQTQVGFYLAEPSGRGDEPAPGAIIGQHGESLDLRFCHRSYEPTDRAPGREPAVGPTELVDFRGGASERRTDGRLALQDNRRRPVIRSHHRGWRKASSC